MPQNSLVDVLVGTRMSMGVDGRCVGGVSVGVHGGCVGGWC